MELIKELLTELVSLPHRGATTDNERTAAGFIEARLKEFGYRVQIDPFMSPPTYAWEIIIFVSLVAAGLILAPAEPILGAGLCLLGAWSFFRYFDGRTTPVGMLIPKKPSQNVMGELSKGSLGGKSDKGKTIYLMAHYDSARASHLYHPAMVKNFRQSFIINTVLVFASPALAVLGAFLEGGLWLQVTAWIMAAYLAGSILMLFHREFFHKHVNGANDNGSGVTAILALAKHFAEHPLENSNVRIVATGCEEEGMYGARGFAKRYGNEFDLENTYVLNFDNVGSGNLRYCVGEGMILFHHYDPALVAKAASIAESRFPDVKPLRYTLAYFDALALVQRDLKTITFIALDENNRIPNWHWYSDTIENIEWPVIKQTVDYGIAMVQAIDGEM